MLQGTINCQLFANLEQLKPWKLIDSMWYERKLQKLHKSQSKRLKSQFTAEDEVLIFDTEPFITKEWCGKVQRKISLWNKIEFFRFAVQNVNDVLWSSCVLCPRLQLWINSSTGESGWKDGSHAVTNGSWWLAEVHPRILGCAGAADCGGAGQKGQGLPEHTQEHRPTQTQGRPGGRQAAATHLRRRPSRTYRDPAGRYWSILLQEPEGEIFRVCIFVARYCFKALHWRPSWSAEAVTISGQLSATRAERLHHFRSLLDSEIGLVSFDLQSRSGCCPLTVCLWRDEKTDVAVILRVSLFWHVIHCWMGGLSQDRK